MEHVSFEQIYWYVNSCPLRKIKEPVLANESKHGIAVRELIHSTLLNLMACRMDTKTALAYVANTIPKAKPKTKWDMSERNRIMVADFTYSALWSAGAWKDYRGVKAKDFVEVGLNFITHGMKANIDLVRFKRMMDRTYLNLTWVVYAFDLPNAEERGKLFQYIQYNARAYSLVSNTVPTQLDIFYPFLNSTLHFIYNPETTYELVAEMILKEAYYAVPSVECNTCRMCPMQWDTSGVLTNKRKKKKKRKRKK